MADSLLDIIFDVVDVAFDVSDVIDRTKQLSKPDTVEVPQDPKPLPPAAQRALAEAEERQRRREQVDQAAIGTDPVS
ncbi:hypothetical protein XH83_07430 [Bradyrhizobium sp. CCBAU 53351]|uniref:hypothetical protein n=1 Tax=Bradyrhizobium sp. CCBAU 53351 TaxID=1325114 RepID=UPI001887BF50|nr:hypothetical protein [Bradyrhizobium sp. CCBAU 53351]QOZ75281.1 hypothetical protein XH83_07430 [Bradyrhizobium sp. CCBAU 53351]